MSQLPKLNLSAKRLSFIAIVLMTAWSAQTPAAEFHVVTGGFLVKATSTTTNGSLANLGAFHAAYEHQIIPGWELSAGYTILVSGLISGDMAFGVDLGINYYPFSASEPYRFVDNTHSFVSTDLWRPYIGAYFAQRQFQVVQSGYAGAGVAVGVERALADDYSLKVIVRHLFFAGASSTTAAETTVLAGVTFSF
jgi:hypothetical protein